MDFLYHAFYTLLRWPVAQIGFAGFRRVHPLECVAQEVELPFRHPADACLLLVDRELQLTHDLAQLAQGLFGLPPLAQDHEVTSRAPRLCSSPSFFHPST